MIPRKEGLGLFLRVISEAQSLTTEFLRTTTGAKTESGQAGGSACVEDIDYRAARVYQLDKALPRQSHD